MEGGDKTLGEGVFASVCVCVCVLVCAPARCAILACPYACAGIYSLHKWRVLAHSEEQMETGRRQQWVQEQRGMKKKSGGGNGDGGLEGGGGGWQQTQE